MGKTSFLVKYNTGEFRLGSFSATVGIALTVSHKIINFKNQKKERIFNKMYKNAAEGVWK